MAWFLKFQFMVIWPQTRVSDTMVEEECSRGKLFITHTHREQRVKLDCCVAFPSRGYVP